MNKIGVEIYINKEEEKMDASRVNQTKVKSGIQKRK